MNGDFSIPAGMIGRFAVVKLWPEIRTAEDECIARLKIAARALGCECVEVHADGSFIDAPGQVVSGANVDFVLHLHYDTPKRYDAFSIVALWNPLRFYHEWGYERTSRNLTTHDDFISCLSVAADDHAARMVRSAATHLPPAFRLFHSTADIIHGPSLGDGKLFYAGINWEAISGGKSRHQEVLKRLDGTGQLRIYGPTIFQGVRVWAGYQSYVKEVPFDGISMIDEISKAGIALVLSSQAHKDSELMSNRLFESIAAGALVICDENAFAARHFGDSLLYIDSRTSEEQMAADILRHLEWAQRHPEQALAMIARAQEIFRGKFTLTRSLRDLYTGLPERQRALRERQNPPGVPAPTVRLFLLMPEYDGEILRAHVASALSQTYPDVSAVLAFDAGDGAGTRLLIEQAMRDAAAPVELRETRFATTAASGIRARRSLGEVLLELLEDSRGFDAVTFVAPNERILSNHVAVLAGALQRDAAVQCAATAALLEEAGEPVHTVHELLDFGRENPRSPTGFGRFMFRLAGIPHDVAIAMRHLDGRPLGALVGSHRVAQQLPATVRIDTTRNFPGDARNASAAAAETAVIRDFAPEALQLHFGYGPRPQRATFDPSPQATLTVAQLVRQFLDLRWLQAQYHALRRHGARSRLQVLRRKLGLR